MTSHTSWHCLLSSEISFLEVFCGVSGSILYLESGINGNKIYLFMEIRFLIYGKKILQLPLVCKGRWKKKFILFITAKSSSLAYHFIWCTNWDFIPRVSSRKIPLVGGWKPCHKCTLTFLFGWSGFFNLIS